MISGNGAFISAGSGTVTTDAAGWSGYGGSVTILSGTQIYDYPNPEALYWSSLAVVYPGLLQLSGNTLTTGSLGGTGTINLGGSGQFGSLTLKAPITAGSMTYSGRLTGNGGLSVSGNSALTLAGLVDYTDGTHISGGTVTTTGNFNPGGTVTVDSGRS